MIPKPGDANRKVTVIETFHMQTDDELTDKELKHIEADDQAIQTILLGLPKDIYAAVDSCETAQEIWFTSNEGESIECYYHRFLKLMNDLKRNNTLQRRLPTKDLHTANYTQLYDFLKYNQKEVDEMKAERLAFPLALMANFNNAYAFPAPHQDQSSFNQNYFWAKWKPDKKEEEGIQLQAEEYDLMAAAADIDEIKEVNLNSILMANLQQASTSGTQTDRAHVYDSDGSAEVHENCDDNEIFNMFTQEEKYTELLEPIPESHQVPQNDNDVISEVTSVEQSGETVEQHPINFEETRALYDSLYQNLVNEVEKVNSVNRKLKETNADLTTELARFKNQKRCFEISQEKYDKLERCYQQSVYQEQCLSKKINALHLSTGKQIMTLNEEISNLNKQLSKEKSTVSSLLEEKKKLKSDFKTHEDELLDKQIQLEKRIKELNNILGKTSQSIQMIHMLSPKPDSFYHTEQKMALGYQNPFCLKQAQKKQQSLYDGKVLLEKHDSPVVDDSEETLENAHLKATYKNLFDSISVSRTQTKTIIASLQNELQSTIYKNAKLRTQLFKKVSDQKDNTHDTSASTKFAKQPIVENLPKVGETNALSKPVTLNFVSTPQEPKVVKNDKVISPGMFRINPDKTSREEKNVPNIVRASNRTKSITVLQPPVFIKKDVNFNLNGLSSTGVDNTKTRRPQHRSNTKHDRVHSASKSSRSKNKEAEVEEHHRNLLHSKNNKHISSACNNIKIDSQDVISKVVCAI
nr:hypothetical protein [Tanacetum cinerariifolium]